MDEAANDEQEPDLVEVFATNDPGLLAVLKGLLDDAHIPHVAQGESFGLTSGGAWWPVRLLVPSDRAAEARALLERTAH